MMNSNGNSGHQAEGKVDDDVLVSFGDVVVQMPPGMLERARE